MTENGFSLIAIVILVAVVVMVGGAWWYIASHQSGQPSGLTRIAGPGESCGGSVVNPYVCPIGYHCAYPTSTLPAVPEFGGTCISDSAIGSCDIATTDFANQQIDTDQFGTLALKNGNYTKNDDAGNPDWNFTLPGSSSLYLFGGATVRVININANHVSGSGEQQIALGYVCSGDETKIKKVLEQSSFGTPVILQSGNNTISVTTWKTYEGAAPPQGRTVTQFKWLNGMFFNTEQSGCPCWDGASGVCLPQTACE
jgi:hypothetical protein